MVGLSAVRAKSLLRLQRRAITITVGGVCNLDSATSRVSANVFSVNCNYTSLSSTSYHICETLCIGPHIALKREGLPKDFPIIWQPTARRGPSREKPFVLLYLILR